jgi:hypothetical protein
MQIFGYYTVVKEIKVNSEWSLICEEPDCLYRKNCANHTTAGDFRTESGLTPELFLHRGKVVCKTIHFPAENMETYWGTWPLNGVANGSYENPKEETDNYEI